MLFALAEGSLLREDGARRMLRGRAQPGFCGPATCSLLHEGSFPFLLHPLLGRGTGTESRWVAQTEQLERNSLPFLGSCCSLLFFL